MPTIIDGSGSATFQTPLPLAQGGNGNTTGNVVSSQVADAFNATGSAPLYACRAWVNFNGTGTVAIRASGNVSSITDNGTGSYNANFTTAMPDANYSVSAVSRNSGLEASVTSAAVGDASSVFVNTLDTDGSALDVNQVFVQVFR